MNRLTLTAVAALAVMGAAACSDREDDVVQPPAAGAAPEPVTETQAQVAQTQAAVAFGMTRQELEDADLLSAQGNTDLGDVETLVLDANGALTSIVVELEGPGDPKVVVAVAQISSVDQNGEKDLTTTLTAAQLQALPAWTPQG